MVLMLMVILVGWDSGVMVGFSSGYGVGVSDAEGSDRWCWW